MRIKIKSFALAKGLPAEVDLRGGVYVFDCRHLPDPYWEEGLEDLTGRDEGVKTFFAAHGEEVRTFLDPVEQVVRRAVEGADDAGWASLTVLFGCVGGQHRSVYCAESLAERLRGAADVEVEVEHTELESAPREKNV